MNIPTQHPIHEHPPQEAVALPEPRIYNRLVRLVIGGAVLSESRWQLQTAKSKFSELVEKACHEGPQIVTKHGADTVVVLAVADYHRLTKPKPHLADLFLESPLRGVALNLARSKDSGREVDL